MEKLKLNLDDLKVESFDTTPMLADQSKGAVYGYDTQQVSCEPTPGAPTCYGPTCYALCTWDACGATSWLGCQNTQDGSTCLCW
jgi:hypothetical protein